MGPRMSPVKGNRVRLLVATICLLGLALVCQLGRPVGGAASPNSTAASVVSTTTANPDECEKCGPTRVSKPHRPGTNKWPLIYQALANILIQRHFSSSRLFW